ncbi:hypothetical protein MKW92_030316 [Papaver armeniacum]|nr:hypothetical protein MKW92_030316 [Papaver armeniacum]
MEGNGLTRKRPIYRFQKSFQDLLQKQEGDRAMWEYLFAVAMDVVYKCLELYQNYLTIHPVKTQIISSGILWGIGDIAAQRITHSRRIKVEVEPHQKTLVNWKRAAITSGFGFGFVGPIGHYCRSNLKGIYEWGIS